MKKIMRIYFLGTLIFSYAANQCSDNDPAMNSVLVMHSPVTQSQYTSPAYGYSSSVGALNAGTAHYAVGSLAILLELYIAWRDAQGDQYLIYEKDKKAYVCPPAVWYVLNRVFEDKPLQRSKEPRATCLCIEGMPGNGGDELARVIADSYQANAIDIDARFLLTVDQKEVDAFFREMAEKIASSDNRTVVTFHDYDLVADYLYAAKNTKHEKIAVNESLTHLLKQPQATCIFLMRDAGRLDWYLSDVIKPRKIKLDYPDMESRARLMWFYCYAYCGKNLEKAASYECIRRIVYHSRTFTVKNIASMCARVAEQQKIKGKITDNMWNKAYYDELAECQKEYNSLDQEYKIGMWDTMSIPFYQLKNFMNKCCYISGL